ncbi:DUF6879 family protein [Nocardia terpenica]|uniref:DUF6879 family protein n=1 Tax=Nocardia terpenica TaxID=455432 RepID=UPI001E483AA0|nr:DUF6879 family protein [Nocardia terpenica]
MGLFRAHWRRAFHLETQDSYNISEEVEPLRKFLAGEPDDYKWCREWDELMAEQTGKGKVVQRVRMVSVPHVDYTRFGLTVAPMNISAGEDVRWLPRPLIDSVELAHDDYWLFDDELAAFVIFRPDGEVSGVAVTDDPVLVAHCATVRDMVWNLAIPHATYIKSEYCAAQ